jgi:hypothetical protein
MFFVDCRVPENYTHIIALGFSESKNKCVAEITPEIVWLNISK